MKEIRPPLLKVDNLRTYIQANRKIVYAVDGVTFELKAGETIAIVGESGCGKTVLCRTIIGLLPENSKICKFSSISFKGKELVGLPEKHYNLLRATEMAIVFQDSLSSLHPVMTVGKQIGESLLYHYKMNRRDAMNKSISLINAVGLPNPDKCANLYPHQLSGGMRQRISLAIALACNPNLLIADEPTTALDTTVQAGILSLLNNLQAKMGMSIVIVTHNLGVASNVADKIAVMYAGKFVEIAPAQELFKKPKHPYTESLIDSIPNLDLPAHKTLFSIEGQSCDLRTVPKGCRYSTRCSRADTACFKDEPVLRTNPEDGHSWSCWHPLRESTF